MTEMINFEKAIELTDDACWYLNKLIECGDEDAVSVLQGLVKARDTFYDCRNELCTKCLTRKDTPVGACHKCRWGE